ncbi:MAG: hypothetical protein AB9891_12840 [Anaerolineaceae bacterium]
MTTKPQVIKGYTLPSAGSIEEPTPTETPTEPSTPTETPTPMETPTPSAQTSTVTTYPTEPTPEPLQHAWLRLRGWSPGCMSEANSNLAPLSEAIRGTMVKGVVNNTTTYYPGRHYNLEVTAAGEKAQKFYFAGGATFSAFRSLHSLHLECFARRANRGGRDGHPAVDPLRPSFFSQCDGQRGWDLEQPDSIHRLRGNPRLQRADARRERSIATPGSSPR